MPWKVGGNFETVWTTCETNWKECAIAVANYLWFEIVSDVVDSLAKEGMIWIIVIAITSTIMFRIKCHKSESKHVENTVNKQTLNKVGCKLQDLELKINVLTYKMQYGTWPLPHQIYNLNPKKLQKIRMTLSSPDDQKGWIKRVLLSPVQSAVYSDIFNRSSVTKLTNLPDVKPKRALHQVQHDELLMDRSNTEISKSTSNQSTKQFLPLNGNHLSSKYVSSYAKDNPCQEFTDSMRKCKSFLKELECNDRERNGASLRDTSATKPTVLFTTKEKNETDETKRIKGTNGKMLEGVGEAHRRSNVYVSDDTFLKQLYPALPISQPASRNTLYEVRRKLQSLHNVLRTYENTNHFYEEHEPVDPAGETDDIFRTVASKSDYINENKTNVNLHLGTISKRDSPRSQCSIVGSCEYFEFNHSEESSSTSASNRTYRCSNDVLSRSSNSEGHGKYNLTRKLRRTSNLNELANDCSLYCNIMLHTPRIRSENRCERDECEHSVSDCELRWNGEVNGNTIRAGISSELREGLTVVSQKTCCVLSSESEDTPALNYTSSTKKFDIEKLSDDERYRENIIIISRSNSQNKVSMKNDKERKSTALLLQEALLFKKALLTRAESEERCSKCSTKENDVSDESLKYGTEDNSNSNFPLMIIDIKTEDSPVDTSHGKLNQRYVHLEMKQRRDLLLPPMRNEKNTFACNENDTDVKNEDLIPETASKYFSINDLTIRDNGEVENSALSSVKSPIYEKVVSITIPVDEECQDVIDTNEKAMPIKAVVLDDSQIRTSSQKNFKEKIAVDDTDSNVVNKLLPSMLKFEDLILERVKNIRDYIDTFLDSQNRAFFKARKALRDLDGNGTFRCLNQASHVILHNRFIASSGLYDRTDQIVNLSKDSQQLDFFVNQRPIRERCKVFVEDELPLDVEYSKLTTRVDSNFTLNKSKHNYSTDRRKKGSNEELIFTCPTSSLDIDKMSNADDHLLNNIESNEPDRTSVNAHRSIKRLHKTRQNHVKAKSDVFLMTNVNKESHINLHPKRSHPSLMRRDTLECIRRILYQSDGKDNELRTAIPSKSIVPLQRISSKSYVPILRNQFGATKAKHQTHTRSPTRGPLTMSWREKTRTKDHTTDEEATRRRGSTPMSKHVHMEETALDLADISSKKNAEGLKEINTAYRDSNIMVMDCAEMLFNDQSLKSSVINERKDKKFICSSKSDTNAIITKHMENPPAAPKAMTIISVMTNDNLRKHYPATSFILKAENVHSANELLKQKTELCAIAVETKEKEITAKPSIIDTHTSMSDIHRIN